MAVVVVVVVVVVLKYCSFLWLQTLFSVLLSCFCNSVSELVVCAYSQRKGKSKALASQLVNADDTSVIEIKTQHYLES